MTNISLEKISLEKRVAQLELQMSKLQRERDKPSWQRAIEKFADDEDLLAIFSEAMKLREAERKTEQNGKAKARKS